MKINLTKIILAVIALLSLQTAFSQSFKYSNFMKLANIERWVELNDSLTAKNISIQGLQMCLKKLFCLCWIQKPQKLQLLSYLQKSHVLDKKVIIHVLMPTLAFPVWFLFICESFLTQGLCALTQALPTSTTNSLCRPNCAKHISRTTRQWWQPTASLSPWPRANA